MRTKKVKNNPPTRFSVVFLSSCPNYFRNSYSTQCPWLPHILMKIARCAHLQYKFFIQLIISTSVPAALLCRFFFNFDSRTVVHGARTYWSSIRMRSLHSLDRSLHNKSATTVTMMAYRRIAFHQSTRFETVTRGRTDHFCDIFSLMTINYDLRTSPIWYRLNLAIPPYIKFVLCNNVV